LVVAVAKNGWTAGPHAVCQGYDFGGKVVGQITPDGQITITSIPWSMQSIIAGPDGNIWTGIERFDTQQHTYGFVLEQVTPDGTVLEFPFPAGHFATALTAGPDGNV